MALVGFSWWQQLLPARLRQAAQAKHFDACLRLGRQLGALRSLQPEEEALLEQCLQSRAKRSWEQGLWWAALDQQRRLVRRSGNPLAADRQLQQWRRDIRTRVLQRFGRGERDQALSLLSSSGETRYPDGLQLQANLRENWANNRYLLEQAAAAAKQKNWWQAMDQLNQLDHPWWKQQSQPLRQRVDAGIAALQQRKQQKDSHGPLPGEPPSDAALDVEVRRQIGLGINELAAFEAACRQLGGKVKEDGPESNCER
jgi:hypothetical protein